MGDSFSPDSYRGIRYNDPMFSVKWPFQPKIISDQDLTIFDYQKKNLRVVITGASGFIGRPLSLKLADLGYEVLAISRVVPTCDLSPILVPIVR